MELVQPILAALLGWLVTLKLLSWLMQWGWGIWTQVSADPAKRSVIAVLAATFLVPGPWVLAIVVALVVRYFDAWWAVWVAAGAGGGVVFFLWAIVVARKRVREGRAS